MLARIVSTGALYKKTLELNLKTIGELSIGKIVNLASNDVQRLDRVSQCLLSTLHRLWSSTQHYLHTYIHKHMTPVSLYHRTQCVIQSLSLSPTSVIRVCTSCGHCTHPRCSRNVAVVVLCRARAQLSAGDGTASPADAPAVPGGQAVR